MSDQSAVALQQIMILTLQNPRQGSERLLALGLSSRLIWLAFSLSVVGSALLTGGMSFLFPLPAEHPFAGFVSSPFAYAGAVTVTQLMFSYALSLSGRPFGGQGRFEQSLLLITWLQFIFLGLSTLQLIAVLISPVLGLIITVGIFGYAGWVLFSMAAALHKLPSLGHGFFVVLLAFVGLALAISLILTILPIPTP